MLQDYVNGTTTNGTFYINNLTIASGDLSVYALIDGYSTEQVTFSYTSQDNITVELYLVNSTGTNTGTHFVSALNEFYITQPDALISLFEYDVSLGSFIKVSECITNSQGECSFSVELGQKKYIITGTKTIDGDVFFDTTSTAGLFISVDNDFTELFLKLSTEFKTTKSTQLNYDITDNVAYLNNYSTNTSSINVSFSTYDGGSTTLCIEYFNISGGNSTSISQTCSIGSSGLIQTSIILNRSFNYNVKIYQIQNSYQILLFDKDIQRYVSFGKTLDDLKLLSPFIILPHLLLLVFAIGSKNILFFFGFEPFIIWFEAFRFPSISYFSIAVLITVVCFISFKNALRKRSELQ